MSNKEEEKYLKILEIITAEPQTTEQILFYLKENEFRCPDGVLKILNMLRKKGKIKGVVSRDAGKWIWWK
jgi:hypothetical protein